MERRHKWRICLGGWLPDAMEFCEWRICMIEDRVYHKIQDKAFWEVWC